MLNGNGVNSPNSDSSDFETMKKTSRKKKLVLSDEEDDPQPSPKRKSTNSNSTVNKVSIKRETSSKIKKEKSTKKRKLEDSDSDWKEPSPKSTKSSSTPKKTPSKQTKTRKSTSTPQAQRKDTKIKTESKEVIKKESTEKAVKVKDESEEMDENGESEEHKWWLSENVQEDNSVKWNTLEHLGPLFPPEYQPHGIKMLYDGAPINLEPEAEEVATYYAACMNSDHIQNSTFNENFFRDFQAVLSNCKKKYPIKDFSKCDFTPIFDHLMAEREKKKQMTKEEKDQIKAEKKLIDDKYGIALIDGRKEKIANFRIEPPGLFRGRGKHPKAGSLKRRVYPEDVTINISKGAVVPEPPPGHSWGCVAHDNTVSWLAGWKDTINKNSMKYVWLAATSAIRCMSDFKKFEKARDLKSCVDKIRKDYSKDLKDKDMVTRQRATALYLIDRLALRAGHEKGDDEADTVGCCSLRCEHITLQPPSTLVFDFLGKDSIRYYNEVSVDQQVYKNIRIFQKDKNPDDDLFDRLTTIGLNKHLSSLMPGLTAKVFRTFNASHTFQEELKNTPADASVAEKLLAYNRANRQVAVLCNHQRAVSKNHTTQLARIQDRILAKKYDRKKIKAKMLELEPKLLKKRPELKDPESDLEDEWITQYEQSLFEKERTRIQQKFTKDNEKRKNEDQDPLPESHLKEKLYEVDEKEAEWKKTGVFPSNQFKTATVEKLEKQLVKTDEQIQAIKATMIDKDENKTTALGTSKINYIDPRISSAWCKKHGVPIEKIFTKTLRDKFKWAMDIDADWVF